MEVRPATPDDAPGIALAHVRSWQAAYRGAFPDAVLDAIDPVERAARWRDVVGRENGVVVAVADDTVLGFAMTAASRDTDDGAASGELFAIYVHPARAGWRDDGVGRTDEVAGHPVGERRWRTNL